jgi:predicted ATPase
VKKSIILITGGPGFGKTKLAERLSETGYRVGGEVARELIAEQQEAGGDVLPWKNLAAFQREVLDRRLAFYHAVPEGEIAFSDRGIPDQLAFSRYKGFSAPKILITAAQEYRYFPVVFVAPPWKDIYRQDEIRTETYDEASHLHDVICKTYVDFGYQLVDLPKVEVEGRVKFIKNYITEL